MTCTRYNMDILIVLADNECLMVKGTDNVVKRRNILNGMTF